MWYEILPSFGIIVGAMSLAPFSAYAINKLVVGNAFRRSTATMDERISYIRDRRLTGDPYKLAGLDGIPSK